VCRASKILGLKVVSFEVDCRFENVRGSTRKKEKFWKLRRTLLFRERLFYYSFTLFLRFLAKRFFWYFSILHACRKLSVSVWCSNTVNKQHNKHTQRKQTEFELHQWSIIQKISLSDFINLLLKLCLHLV